MNRTSLLRCVLAVSLSACGGTAELAGNVALDGGAEAWPDAPATQDAGDDGPSADSSLPDVAQDVPPADFCSGHPKARWGAETVESPVITTSMLYMDCCEGAVVRLHTRAALGFDYAVTVVGHWPLKPGEYELDPDAGSTEVSVSVLGDPSPMAPATGTLHIGESVTTELRIGFCAETHSEALLGNSRLYVPEAFVAPYNWNQRFEIHLLSDKSMTAVEASKYPLQTLNLDPEPVVDLMSVGWYEGSTHFVHWDAWSGTQTLLSKVGQIPVQGTPFVVVADGQRIYLGAFMTLISSYAIDAPLIMKEEMTDGGFQIKAPMTAQDPRSDPRVLKALQESWKLGP